VVHPLLEALFEALLEAIEHSSRPLEEPLFILIRQAHSDILLQSKGAGIASAVLNNLDRY
jgi:hypothetical protein